MPLDITLTAADADAADSLTYAITRPPRIATLTRSDGSAVPAEGWTSASPPVVIATATSAGWSAYTNEQPYPYPYPYHYP